MDIKSITRARISIVNNPAGLRSCSMVFSCGEQIHTATVENSNLPTRELIAETLRKLMNRPKKGQVRELRLHLKGMDSYIRTKSKALETWAWDIITPQENDEINELIEKVTAD